MKPQRGRPTYQYTDKVVAWCREHGIRMKGHPLLWGDQAGVPPWSHGQPSPEIQRQRVEDIIGRYQGKIEFWEVVNEPSHLAEPKIDQPYRWARQADPRACLIVNDYSVLADGGPGFFKLLTAAKQNGVPFDGIGIQAHEPSTMRFPLDRVQEILDQYATLGKGLNITEFTPTSAGQKITGSHREGVWDEAAQADYAVKFYRVCFAHPAMRAITWWDLSDQSSWQPGGGMLRADMSPKPVYEQLKRLIHEEWKTALHATTDRRRPVRLPWFLRDVSVGAGCAGAKAGTPLAVDQGSAKRGSGQRRLAMKIVRAFAIALLLATPVSAQTVDALAGKKIVFLGDSITQAGEYVTFTAYYLEQALSAEGLRHLRPGAFQRNPVGPERKEPCWRGLSPAVPL